MPPTRSTESEKGRSSAYSCDDERELLEMFRAAPLAAKADAIKVLQGNARKGSMSQAQQTFNAPVSGRVAGRDYREHDPPTKRGAKKR